MSDLPDGWELVELQDLAAAEPRSITDGPFGSNLKTAHYTDAGPRVLRLQNIGFGEFIDEYAHISEEHFESLRNHEVEGGDLVVASLGENLPRSCVTPPSVGPAIVKADCIRVRLHADIDARYVNYALQRPELKAAVADQIHGVGRPRLGMEGIRALSVPLAPKPEQARIVAAIEEHLSRLDAARTSLASAEAGSKRLRGALLAEVVRGDWAAMELGEVVLSLRNGCFVSRPAVEPPGLPILRISAVRPLRLDVEDVRYARAVVTGASAFEINAGDILFTRYSGNPAYVGACAVVPPDGAGLLHPDKLIRGVPNPDLVLPEWIALVLTASRGRREIERRLKTTAGQVGISGGQLRSVPVPVPPLEIQQRRVEAWLAHSEVLDRLIAALEGAQRRGESLARSVLAEAFSGQLVDQDPADEPASALLDRIRQARSTSRRKTKVHS